MKRTMCPTAQCSAGLCAYEERTTHFVVRGPRGLPGGFIAPTREIGSLPSPKFADDDATRSTGERMEES